MKWRAFTSSGLPPQLNVSPYFSYWWNYSNMPLNINGGTAVPAVLLFSVGGLIAVYLIMPLWMFVVSIIPPFVLELLCYFVVIVIAVDATLTINALTTFQEQVERIYDTLNIQAEEATEKLTAIPEQTINRISVLGDTARTKIAEEKSRITEEGISRLMDNMNFALCDTLKRVKGFRYTNHPSGKHAIRLSNKPINATLSDIASSIKERANKYFKH